MSQAVANAVSTAKVIPFNNTRTTQRIRQSLVSTLVTKYSYTYLELVKLSNQDLTILLNTEKGLI
jgi:hypothetical protein